MLRTAMIGLAVLGLGLLPANQEKVLVRVEGQDATVEGRVIDGVEHVPLLAFAQRLGMTVEA